MEKNNKATVCGAGTDESAVRAQYSTADNLSARISIHDKYSVNPTGYQRWLFSQYTLRSYDRILELGCGNGVMWRECHALLPEGCELVLTDFSQGMLDAARQTLGGLPRIDYECVDIRSIPYPEYSMDVAIANNMLYHVPDLDAGLMEVKRVLRNRGCFYCATYGENGVHGYLRELLRELVGETGDVLNRQFTLQNGESKLAPYFREIETRIYEDALAITDVDDLIAYIRSLSSLTGFDGVSDERLRDALEKRREGGVIRIPKEVGMFACIR